MVKGPIDGPVRAGADVDLVDDILKRLRSARTDEMAFAAVIAEIETRSVSKSDTCLLAACYTGARPSSFRTKKAALAAIRAAFAERCYLASKRDANAHVTPW